MAKKPVGTGGKKPAKAKTPIKAKPALRPKAPAKAKAAAKAKAKATVKRQARAAKTAPKRQPDPKAALLRLLQARAKQLLGAAPGLTADEVVARIRAEFPEVDELEARPFLILPAAGKPSR